MTKNSLLIALAAAAILLMAATPGGATIVSPPSDDAGTSQESPNGNTGSLYLIWVRNANGAGGAIWQMDGLFRFDLSEMPAAWPVTSAHLYIYYHGWWDNNPAGHALPAFRITSAWSESTVTWNNAPPSVAGATSTATVPGAGGQWMVWDVTADVQAVAGGTPNSGWRIPDPVSWGGGSIPVTRLRSKEYTQSTPYNLPYLEVSPDWQNPVRETTWGRVKALFR